jgi:N-formylglutamate deformylase
MSQIYELILGSNPVLISMPHDGYQIPESIARYMTQEGRSSRDTDWYVSRLYQFAQHLGCYMIRPFYSRYVIDLNRPVDDAPLYPGMDTTGLIPLDSFRKKPLYLPNQEPDAAERQARIKAYWQPYHQALSDTLAEIRSKFGVAVLFDAHSIASEVPRFFEGRLPDLNFGNNDGQSCERSLLTAIASVPTSEFSTVFNGRFKGGYITRHYGKPEQNIHAVQLELSWRTYLDESEIQWNEHKAKRIQPILEAVIGKVIEWANNKAR